MTAEEDREAQGRSPEAALTLPQGRGPKGRRDVRQAAFSHPSDRTHEAAWMDLTEPTGPRRGIEVRALTAPDGAADTSQRPQEAVSHVR